MANEDPVDQDHGALLEGVRRWIHREGYPLEYATARELHRSGLITEQGHYFVDESEAPPKAREIDVVAWFPPPDSNARVVVRLAVECKHATAPWVVFTTEQDIDPVDVLASSAASHSARNVLVRRARLVREHHAVFPEFFTLPRRHGFGVVQAFGRGGDPHERGRGTESPEQAVSQILEQAGRGALRLSPDEEVEH
jgi:hypothetical protein